jgi:hypothetical protein
MPTPLQRPSLNISASSSWAHFIGPKPADAPLQVPGRSVQLDMEFVPRVGKARQRLHQFTAIDEAPGPELVILSKGFKTKKLAEKVRLRYIPTACVGRSNRRNQ